MISLKFCGYYSKSKNYSKFYSLYNNDLIKLSMQFAGLFAKLPWPGYSKVTFSIFESSCFLLTTNLTTQR